MTRISGHGIFNIKMIIISGDHYYWFYSTLAQSLAALIGVTLVLAVFRLQIVYTNLERKLNDFVNLLTAFNPECKYKYPYYTEEELSKVAKTIKLANMPGRENEVNKIGIREGNILKLKNYRECLKFRVMFLIIYLSMLFGGSMICLNFVPYYESKPDWAIYYLRNTFVVLCFGGWFFIRFCWYCINFAVVKGE